MSDQAAKLRSMMNQHKVKDNLKKNNLKIITITSGKGGVGKSNLTTNLALSLIEQGKRPLVLDADFGLSNIEIILGERATYNLAHVLNKKVGLKDIVIESQYGLPFISGGAGVKEMMFLSSHQIEQIATELTQIEELTDMLLIDTGAGINDIVLKFSAIADEIYVVVTPEPTSITDSYALIKTLVKDFDLHPTIKIIINKAESKHEALGIFKKLQDVVQHFLQTTIHYGGYIPYDEKLFQAVKAQKPVVVYDKKARASIAYKELSKMLIPEVTRSEENNWIGRFKKVFKYKGEKL